jgi:isoleucyl-tRNA synthetase
MNQPETEARKSQPAQKEEQILEYWHENNVFEKTLDKDSPEGEFVFYEGPPTANGQPAIHHLESRVFKDAIPRYKTMQGYHVPRKGGWDTHGLPVELEVEKDLDIDTKGEIEEYGVGEFNKKCKESVWKYIEEWEAFTKRMGYWLDLDNPYVTYEPDYMESVWNRFAQADERDLVYKDYKVVPWCPRCETALSSHEQAQGYETVKDLAVTAKFELIDALDEVTGGDDTYVLAWTTTPWTLPANLALAVSEEITYVRITTYEDDGSFILAKDRLDEIVDEADKEYEIEDEFSGDKLAGLRYQPLYPYAKDKLKTDEFAETRDNAFQIYAADFVTTEEGTGIVHTAVMYGQDDFELGEAVDLPRLHLVDQTGHFKEGTDFLARRFVHEEELAVDIIKDLYHRDVGGETGLLFDKGKFEHEYPHCWRCDTPLVYYARNSWYIAMTEMREDLLEENEKINWEPEHIKDGRFGEWLDGVQDWAVSRERFWGTPLPIWESEDGESWEVIDSLEALKEKTASSNNFWAMRHGGAEHNEKNEVNSGELDKYGLTEKGEKSVHEIADDLEDIDLIFTSPFRRCQETADIIADELGLKEDAIKTDKRLREYDFGEFDSGPMSEYREWRDSQEGFYTTPTPGGESFLELKRRHGDFLYDINKKQDNKNILIVSHGGFLETLPAVLSGADVEESARVREENMYDPGHVEAFAFSPIPHNADYELDLHRPYIDEITWETEDGQTMSRVSEVMDCWFDSGSMPYAQHHYPFENEEYVEETAYPADFIAEAIDQTRGWFYTLHAIGVFSEMGRAYENVISLGLIRDADGNKMSKSVGNVVDPWAQMDKFGVDAIRFWMYSVNQPGEDKDYAEETVDEIQKKVFNLARNVNRFYKMYGGDEVSVNELPDPYESTNPLDRWILRKLNDLIKTATDNMDDYNLLTPTRAIRDFVGDLSRWYLRRSRDRIRDGEGEDREYALATIQHVLETLAKLMAPFTPFFAEELYQAVTDEVNDESDWKATPDFSDGKFAGSVHLAGWPEAKGDERLAEDALLAHMELVREAASEGRDLRSQEGLKVRQPLSTLQVADGESSLAGEAELLAILKDEVNVREVSFGDDIDGAYELDTEITEELAHAGAIREVIRQVQKLRKQAELDPQEEVELAIETSNDGRELIEDNKAQITNTANISDIRFTDVEDGAEVSPHDVSFRLQLPQIE